MIIHPHYRSPRLEDVERIGVGATGGVEMLEWQALKNFASENYKFQEPTDVDEFVFKNYGKVCEDYIVNNHKDLGWDTL